MSHPVTPAPTQASDHAAGGNHYLDTEGQITAPAPSGKMIVAALPGHVSDFWLGGGGGHSRQLQMRPIDADRGTRPMTLPERPRRRRMIGFCRKDRAESLIRQYPSGVLTGKSFSDEL